MKGYRDLPESWSKVINAEARSGRPFEELVFIEQADGSLKPFGPGAPSLGRKAGHCVIVESVSTDEHGQHKAHFVFATPTALLPN